LPDNSVKLVYGSPPYPNAVRDYGTWRSKDYVKRIAPFIDAAKVKLREDGFLVINVKACREKHGSKMNSTRSLVVEKLAILMEEEWALHCVDIEVWVKSNPVTTGLRVACQDAYEQILWFAKSNPWSINLDAIRRSYSETSLKTYDSSYYKPRSNGLTYVRKQKKIQPNPLGALPKNVVSGPVSSKRVKHQAVQPEYLPNKYILATTNEGDLVVDPWMGTGTTGVEALKLGRLFAGFDVVQEYVNIAEKRLAEVPMVLKLDNTGV